MSVNPNILSIPPHLSVAWSEVSSLQVQNGILLVHLKSGRFHEVPNLSEEDIKRIFAAHEASLTPNTSQDNPPKMEMSFGMPFRMAEGMEGMGIPMQHNPDQKNAPDMPADVLDKIVTVSKALGVDQEAINLPPAEPHCNCFYCQIARALQGETHQGFEYSSEEIEVPDEELQFREDWIVNPTEGNKQLYLVANPLNAKEQYSVFLGEPIGCTCGEKNCEHIRAVLNS
ncbi:MAG: hypothetical protein H7A39_06500 [Chlamydiales bacterium]|nr:hypothetical protein [Chlamydiales bacterium]